MSEGSVIRIKRARSPWRDRLRSYKVVVDDEHFGSVRNGRTKDFAVAPGPHTVRLKVDWMGSLTVEIGVGPGATVVLAASAHESGKSAVSDLMSSIDQRDAWIDLAEE